jgi:hypothetical protein
MAAECAAERQAQENREYYTAVRTGVIADMSLAIPTFDAERGTAAVAVRWKLGCTQSSSRADRVETPADDKGEGTAARKLDLVQVVCELSRATLLRLIVNILLG